MHKNKKRLVSALTGLAMMVSSMPFVTAPVFAETGKNIITNSTFENGSTDWGVYKESGGLCSLSTEDGKLALTVGNVGQVNYAVQMFYDIVPLYQNGVYRLKFDISATVPRYVEAMIQQNGGTYQAYTWKGIDVTTEPQTIDYEFTMEEESDIMAKFCFNCGLQEKDGELSEHKIYLDNVSLELVDDSQVDYSSTRPYVPPININQVGYKPDGKKTAVIRQTPNIDGTVNAHVVNADTKEVVYSAPIGNAVENTSAGETDFLFDFSEVKTVGKYYIQCDGIEDTSYTFEISDNIYSNLLDDSVRMLYLQRCGVEVEDETFGHKPCHDSIATIYGTSQQIEVNGGWHDAGDYGRYVVPAAKAVADLMYAYLENPELYSDNIGIPESSNGVADVLDEARFELEWMLKMQNKDSGGVYHKVSCATFPGYVMPEEETKPLIVMPETTTSTADFAASMALAYEVYKDIDADFANKCLSAAKKAYDWAKQNPNELYLENPADISTGAYEDKSATDEIYWASIQLYRATGDTSYISDVSSAIKGLDWATVGDYGNIAILTMKNADKESTLYKNALSAVIKQADDFTAISQIMPYGVSQTKYNWGSNMTIANSGIILGLAYKLTGDSKYLTSADAQLDYLLGVNPVGTCFVTGYGTVSPQTPHHRPSMAKDTAMKGMLVGGVNSALEDSAAKAYCRDLPPALCYVDNSESYSTNEITIYWNSPLTYLLSLTDSPDGGSSDPEPPTTTEPSQGEGSETTTTPTAPSDSDDYLWGDANCDGSVTIADSVAILQYLANGDEYKLSDKGMLQADVNLNGNGVNTEDALAIQKLDAKVIDKLPESYLDGDTPATTTTVGETENTTPETTSTTTAQQVTENNGIKDYGTPMNANATAVEDFRDGSSSLFFASDGWTNGNPFDCGWYKQNTSLDNNMLSLTIDKDYTGQYNYSGAEYRTNDHYSYGYYETSMQAIKNNGVVSSFFTYTGPSEDNPWDEIDIEILGKDTTKVQFNYYTNGVGNHEFMYDLGFDASEGFHTYGFDWQPDHIAWFIDGKEVYRATENIPSTPGRIMMNTWNGIGVDEWLNPFDGNTPLTAHYQWVTYNK